MCGRPGGQWIKLPPGNARGDTEPLGGADGCLLPAANRNAPAVFGCSVREAPEVVHWQGREQPCVFSITFAGHAEAARHVAGRARLRRTAWSRCRCAAVAQQRREGAVAMRMHDASLLGARHGRGVVYPMRAGCGGAVEAGGRQWCGMRVCMCCALYCCVSRKYSLRGRGGFLPFFLALQAESKNRGASGSAASPTHRGNPGRVRENQPV